MSTNKYKVVWEDAGGNQQESQPLLREHAEHKQQGFLSRNVRATIEKIIDPESRNLAQGKYQVYLDGFGIFPNVPKDVFESCDLLDAMGDKVDIDSQGRTTKRYPDPEGVECMFPVGGRPCYVVEDGVVSGAFSSALDDIPKISREEWNREWDWISYHDLSKYTFFAHPEAEDTDDPDGKE